MLNYKEYIYAIYQEHSFSKAAQKLFRLPALAQLGGEEGGTGDQDPPL